MIRFRPLQFGPIFVRRDTLVLLIVATAVPFAVSHRIHERNGESADVVALERPAWTGQIADLTPSDTASSADAITSASLVVPSSALALPRSPTHVEARTLPCLGSDSCSKPPPLTPRQKTASIVQPTPLPLRERKTDFLTKLNPLAHLPEPVWHPLDSARAVLTGWFRQL